MLRLVNNYVQYVFVIEIFVFSTNRNVYRYYEINKIIITNVSSRIYVKYNTVHAINMCFVVLILYELLLSVLRSFRFSIQQTCGQTESIWYKQFFLPVEWRRLEIVCLITVRSDVLRIRKDLLQDYYDQNVKNTPIILDIVVCSKNF